MTTESMEFSDIESIKILFEPTKRVCLEIRLNNTSRNNVTRSEKRDLHSKVKIYMVSD